MFINNDVCKNVSRMLDLIGHLTETITNLEDERREYYNLIEMELNKVTVPDTKEE